MTGLQGTAHIYMKQQKYQKPRLRQVQLWENCNLMAASGSQAKSINHSFSMQAWNDGGSFSLSFE